MPRSTSYLSQALLAFISGVLGTTLIFIVLFVAAVLVVRIGHDDPVDESDLGSAMVRVEFSEEERKAVLTKGSIAVRISANFF